MRITVEISRKRLLLLLIYFIFYGVFIINVIDLNILSSGWFHIFLILLCFYPSIGILLISKLRNWNLALALGLLVSLMNDLFFAPIGNLLSASNYNLLDWYMRQLGFQGLKQFWTFQGGIITFKVTSIAIGLSVYARLIVVIYLLVRYKKSNRYKSDSPQKKKGDR